MHRKESHTAPRRLRFGKTLPTSDVYCPPQTRPARNELTPTTAFDGWLRMVSDRIKDSARTNKQTQPFSTVSSWGQSGPCCRVTECSRTLFYNLLPLMQSSSTEWQGRLLSTIHPSLFHSQTHKVPKRGQFKNLQAKMSRLSKSGPGTQCTVRFNGLMGQVVALHLAMKHQRIHRGRIEQITAEWRPSHRLTRQFYCVLVSALASGMAWSLCWPAT